MAGGHAPGGAVVAVSVALTIISVMATALRLFTRTAIMHNSGFDDVCIASATFFSVLLAATMCEEVNYGTGRHFASLTELEQTRSLQWTWASIWIYYLALGSVKISILSQYLRIFPQRRFRTACFIMIGVNVIYMCWSFFSAVFACTPVAYFWNPKLGGHCLNRTAVWFSNAAINIVTDIGTAALPLPVLKALQVPKKQKLALMCVFGLGGFTCIISILRLQSLYAISKANDITYENGLAAIWSTAEVNIGILCSCLPTLKGCVVRYCPRFFQERTNRSYTIEIPDNATFSRSRQNTSCTARALREKGMEDARTQSKVQGTDEGTIHVVTVLEQEIEHDKREEEYLPYESSSMRNLVVRESFHAV